MESEASAIARKLKNMVIIENEIPIVGTPKPGIVRSILMTAFMGLAVVLSSLTLYCVKLIKRFE